MKQKQEEKKDYDFTTTISAEQKDCLEVIYNLNKNKPVVNFGKDKITFNVKGTMTFELEKLTGPECRIKLNAV